MRWVRAKRNGSAFWGASLDGGVTDLSPVLAGQGFGALLSDETLQARARAHVDAFPAEMAHEDVELLAPLLDDAKIICVGLNYHGHIAETGRTAQVYPTLFVRWADSFVGDRAPILRPQVSEEFDYEGELAIVVGRPGRHIAQARALDHVAGSACLNDGSVRDWQRHTTQFTAGKNFAESGGFGPWITTADEAPLDAPRRLITRLNGEVVQEASTAQMIFSPAALVAYVSTFTPLRAGDVIATGTPDGAGAFREPKLWMKAGDRVEVEIEGVGRLCNPVADAPAYTC